MHFGVLVFPGSNCDRDTVQALEQTLDATVAEVWHEQSDVSDFDALIIPGGFSYGDYLRSGAIARQSPVMAAIESAAGQGKMVVGICNGFQILTEAGLLPGALLRNEEQKFRCDTVGVRVTNAHTSFSRLYKHNELLQLPVAHGDGRYFVDERTLERMRANKQIVFTYETGENPNGSVADIAGVCNEAGNVLGLMPHPERAMKTLLGSRDGRRLFGSMVESWVGHYNFSREYSRV